MPNPTAHKRSNGRPHECADPKSTYTCTNSNAQSNACADHGADCPDIRTDGAHGSAYL